VRGERKKIVRIEVLKREVAKIAIEQWTVQILIRSNALLLVCPQISDNHS
jgi:hypothetical protein